MTSFVLNFYSYRSIHFALALTFAYVARSSHCNPQKVPRIYRRIVCRKSEKELNRRHIIERKKRNLVNCLRK
ncbi:hypothetical protein GE21DRAFT_1034163 [Neurospora crassa]|nr:hypothetical protein GE21DRAFT_1034163 [Neurospora crassa]